MRLFVWEELPGTQGTTKLPPPPLPWMGPVTFSWDRPYTACIALQGDVTPQFFIMCPPPATTGPVVSSACSILHLRHLDFGLCYLPLTSANCTHQVCNLASDHLLLVHSGSWALPEHSCHLSQGRGSPCTDTHGALL